MDSLFLYKQWLESEHVTPGERQELEALEGEEIRERFGGSLAFGTAGLRGRYALGTACINRFTVARAVTGFAMAVGRGKTALVCYDGRRGSRQLAEVACACFEEQGIEASIFSAPRPTPELSFAVRFMEADCGINITASHNPKNDNGLKLYGAGGAQISTDEAARIAGFMAGIPLLRRLPVCEEYKYISGDIDRQYIESVTEGRRGQPGAGPKCLFTPLHGVAGKSMIEACRAAGFDNVRFLESQMEPDGDFPLCASPNPEYEASFSEALRSAGDAEIILAADPDGDRIGVMARDADGRLVHMSANLMGALMLEHMLLSERPAGKCAVIKTVVSSDLAARIAESAGLEVHDTLTGFKNMAQRWQVLEQEGIEPLLAYEESFGYMPRGDVRDKDGIAAAIIILGMAQRHHSRGRTLPEAAERLMQLYGWHIEKSLSIYMEGADGAERLGGAMSKLREGHIAEVAACAVSRKEDFLLLEENGSVREGTDLLIFHFEQGGRLCIRPSGTEPKLKIYSLARADSRAGAEELAESRLAHILQIINA